MKRIRFNAAFTFFLIAIVMMTLPTQTLAEPFSHFYGELDQWDDVDTDLAISLGNSLHNLKAVMNETTLYIYLEQANPAEPGTIYLATGQDPFAYLGRGLWASDTKIDYKIENNTLYGYDGTGFDEAWRKISEVTSIILDGAILTKVELAAMKLHSPQPVQIAYFLNGLNYLPTFSNSLWNVPQTNSLGDELVQKDVWNKVVGPAKGQDTYLELKAVRDQQKLFVLIQGNELNPRNTYYLDLGQGEGFTTLPWRDANANFKVENGTLFAFSGTPERPRWTKLDAVHTYITADSIVMSLELDLLNTTSDAPIKIGYINSKEHFLPGIGEEMVAIHATIEQPIVANTYYPREYYGMLNNPYKGWAPSALYGPYNQPHRLVHAYISWRELEPEQGVFAWEALETKNFFDQWYNKGVQVITRIMLDYPTDNPNLMEIPDWLYEMIDGDGTWYQTSEIGSGFSPNYANPKLIAEHERMLKAFGERYNNDPRIAFIQLGSIGHWGEWHTWPNGSGEFPSETVVNQYMQHYTDSLPDKMLGIRRPLAFAREHNFGFFNDKIGHAPTTEQWMFWMHNGMDYDNWYNRRVYPEAAIPDFWHTAYSAGEFSDGNALMWLRDTTVSDTLRQVRLMHTSWIGPCSPAGVGNIPEAIHIQTVHNTIGYHFVIETVTHLPAANAGENLAIQMTWHNKGVAPFYFNWPLELGLIDENGTLVFTTVLAEDITRWLPGRNSVELQLGLPQNLEAGTYRLVTAILNPETGKPGIDLGITERRADGRYALSTIEILP